MNENESTSAWQNGFCVQVLEYLYPSDIPVLRLVCRYWEAQVNGLVTSLAPNSVESLGAVPKFSNLQELDLRYIPYPENEDEIEEVESVSHEDSPRRGRCPWCTIVLPWSILPSWDLFKNMKCLYCPLGCCDSCVSSMSSAFPQIDQIQCAGGYLTDAGLQSLRRLPLAEVHLHSAGCITDDGMAHLAEHGARLRKVIIHGAGRISDAGVTALSKYYASTLGPTKGLQILSLSSCTRVKGEGLSCFPGLVSLSLAYCKYVTDLALQDLQHLPHLRVLSLAGCFHVTDGGLECLRGLGLQHLDLEGCNRVSDQGLSLAVGRLKGLRILILEGLHGLTDDGLAALAGCQLLEKLSLKGCSQISDEGLEGLMPCLPRLRWLDVSGCRRLTQRGLTAIARHLPGLSHLALAHCTGVGNSGLATLGAAELPLCSLNLSACPRITGTGIAALQPLARTLHTLDLSWCDLNDPAALQLHSLGRLRHLHVDGCSRISARAAASLISRLQLSTFSSKACSRAVERLGFRGVPEAVSVSVPVFVSPRKTTASVGVQTDPGSDGEASHPELRDGGGEESAEKGSEVPFPGSDAGAERSEPAPPDGAAEAALASVPEDLREVPSQPSSEGPADAKGSGKGRRKWLGRMLGRGGGSGKDRQGSARAAR
uniref:F-box and leucine-rich repeat protein 7 n=1 Tax=Tetraselmis sp. GSL018 TaxID=582737 RepID=A0A061R9X5_9CHLO